MVAETQPVRIFQLTAVASDDNERFRSGDRHALIAYVSGATEEDFPAILLEALVDHGWKDYQFTRSGFLTPEAMDDEIVRSAQENGVALVSYGDPIK
jgi:hypothetical protein